MGDISRWMHWLLTTHSHRHHRGRESSGRVWQGRFKTFPIQQDGHLLTVMRYVERNALRAGLAERAEDWTWGSLAWRRRGRWQELLAPPPTGLHRNWLAWVNSAQTSDERASALESAPSRSPSGQAEKGAGRTLTGSCRRRWAAGSRPGHLAGRRSSLIVVGPVVESLFTCAGSGRPTARDDPLRTAAPSISSPASSRWRRSGRGRIAVRLKGARQASTDSNDSRLQSVVHIHTQVPGPDY